MPTQVIVTDHADVRYLQAAGGLLQGAKPRSYALMQAVAGQHILDVGCGPGIDTVALAQLVGPSGREAAAQAGTFFAMLGGVMAAGRKPRNSSGGQR